jgi:hypothetical protein
MTQPRSPVTGPNGYGVAAFQKSGHASMNRANSGGSDLSASGHPISNRAAGISVFLGLIAVVLTFISALPGSPVLWIYGASLIAVLCSGYAILRRIQGRATNLWAPVIGILLGISAAAVTLLGINVIGLVNSATGGLIPTASTTLTPVVAPQTSPEPFVFANNPILTGDGTTVQQIATALNRTFASGNSTLGAGQTWPASLQFTDTQVIAPSGAPLLTVAAGHTFTYKPSADHSGYSLSATGGDGTEFALYYSDTNSFSFSCPLSATNCVPVH